MTTRNTLNKIPHKPRKQTKNTNKPPNTQTTNLPQNPRKTKQTTNQTTKSKTQLHHQTKILMSQLERKTGVYECVYKCADAKESFHLGISIFANESQEEDHAFLSLFLQSFVVCIFQWKKASGRSLMTVSFTVLII